MLNKIGNVKTPYTGHRPIDNLKTKCYFKHQQHLK